MAEVALPPASADPAALARLVAALDGAAGATRYIGGWVRDTLLGLAPQDLDLATRLAPQDALVRAEAAGLTVWSSASGLAHGTIGVVVGGRTIEVTTLRRDVETDGRHAVVAFTDDWREDAARRDFTINALSADAASGAVHDYFGGLADLAAGRVRFIGDPDARIAEDRLRILRFFRFHARFGRGDPDAAAYLACIAHARELMALSRERIAAELLKLLALPAPLGAVDAMLAGGILAPFLPEIADTARLDALLAAEDVARLPADGIRRLAALLPQDRTVADAVAARLRLSRADRRRLVLDTEPAGHAEPAALAYANGAPVAVDRLLLAGRSADAASLSGWARPDLPIRGSALIARGLVPGPGVAAALGDIERRWIAAGFPAGDAFETIVADVLARADQSAMRAKASSGESAAP